MFYEIANKEKKERIQPKGEHFGIVYKFKLSVNLLRLMAENKIIMKLIGSLKILVILL